MDYHLVMDLIPNVARIFFLKQLGDVSLSAAQCVSLALLVFVCQWMKQKKGRYHHQDIFQRLFFRAGREVLDLLSDASSPALMFQALLLGIGLQHKSVDQLEKEIELPSSQLMGLFNRLIRKFVQASPSSSQTTEKMLFLRIKKREILIVLAFSTAGFHQHPRKSHRGRNGGHQRCLHGADHQKFTGRSGEWSHSSASRH